MSIALLRLNVDLIRYEIGKIPLIRLEVDLRERVRFDSGEQGLMVGIGILMDGGVLRARRSVFMVR
jgi:hypothetical protein